MKHILLYIGFIISSIHSYAYTVPGKNQFNYTAATDSLPTVLTQNRSDIIGSKLKNESFLRFAQHQLPKTKQEWGNYRTHLRNEIIKKAGVLIDHQLPLDYKETGTIKMQGYSIKNIVFQTRPGVYATANLYIPDGNGPFPGIINMNGHWREARNV